MEKEKHRRRLCSRCERFMEHCVFSWGRRCRSCGNRQVAPKSLRTRAGEAPCGCTAKERS